MVQVLLGNKKKKKKKITPALSFKHQAFPFMRSPGNWHLTESSGCGPSVLLACFAEPGLYCPLLVNAQQGLCSGYLRGYHHAEMVKNLPARREIWVQFLGEEDPLEKGMTTHPSIFAWRIMDRGAWQATVHGIAESDRTEWLSLHFIMSPTQSDKGLPLGIRTPLFISNLLLGLDLKKWPNTVYFLIF